MDVAEELEARRHFMDLVRTARTEHFEKGSIAEDAILSDAIAADEKLWKRLQPAFAKEAALGIVRRVVKGTPLAFDGPQQRLFEDLPQRITVRGGGWKPINKATVADFRWHVDWTERRVLGNAKRTAQDTEELERLKAILEKVQRSAKKDEGMLIEQALEKGRRPR